MEKCDQWTKNEGKRAKEWEDTERKDDVGKARMWGNKQTL